MLPRFLSLAPVIISLAACGGGGGGGDTPMTQDPGDNSDPTVIVTDNTTAFSDILAAQDAIDSTTFFQITQIADFPSGGAEYEGVATIQTNTDRRADTVSFIALGRLEAEVDFPGNSMTATASDFYELDAAVYNNSFQTRALSEIEGEITVVSGIGSEAELSDLLGEPQVVALGLGAASGSVTQRDGTVLDFDGTAGVTFFNAQDEDAAVLVIGGPSSTGQEDLDAPFNSFSMIGLAK